MIEVCGILAEYKLIDRINFFRIEFECFTNSFYQVFFVLRDRSVCLYNAYEFKYNNNFLLLCE
jgi:hypothetical protein